MNLHHSVDPRLWNLESELRMFALDGPPVTRRTAIRAGLLGSAGALLGNSLLARAAAPAPALKPKAKSVIQVWLWGGPSHLDTFDPKPAAGNDYTGPLNTALATNVAGIQIGELLPLLAKQADKYALIRSMTHGSNSHETAAYTVQTGRASGGRDVFPGVGAVVSLFKGYEAGYKGLLPPYIVLTELQGRFSESGFLGPRYKPFATGGNPRDTRFVVEGVVAPGISEERQRARRELLHQLNTLERATTRVDPRLAAFAQCEQDAYEMILGDAGKVFDLAQEKGDARERYGSTTFGQSCLMARRLVERGVPYVTINYKGWDTHKQHFQSMRRMLPELDRGVATLLADLKSSGLLDTTIVWVGGRVRPHAESPLGGTVERRPQPLRRGVFRPRGRGWLQGWASGRRLRRARRGSEGSARPSVRSDRQHVRTPGHRSRGPAPAPGGHGRPRDPHSRSRRDTRRPVE